MDNKERFSDRVDAYVKYRPSYPREAIDYLFGTLGFAAGSTAADVGAGTGNFTALLLERKVVVYAVEPNPEMRSAAERKLSAMPNFHSAGGSAEQTGLPDKAVDFVVSAQAFHWFDRAAAKREFGRILKPGGQTVLIWNSRLTEGTPFLAGYEQLLRTLGTDYEKVNHRNITTEDLQQFFAEGQLRKAVFPNRQLFDFDGLLGRLQSSSYSPKPGHPNYEPMIAALRELFDRCQTDGTVSFDYETEIYSGPV
jgi:SAM-dependent methyltransferase